MIMMHEDGKGTIEVEMKLKLKWNRLKKNTTKEHFDHFDKDVVHLIDTNHQINMTFEHLVPSNTSFKKHLNSKSVKIFWE